MSGCISFFSVADVDDRARLGHFLCLAEAVDDAVALMTHSDPEAAIEKLDAAIEEVRYRYGAVMTHRERYPDGAVMTPPRMILVRSQEPSIDERAVLATPRPPSRR
jgi:hypothetical protein